MSNVLYIPFIMALNVKNREFVVIPHANNHHHSERVLDLDGSSCAALIPVFPENPKDHYIRERSIVFWCQIDVVKCHKTRTEHYIRSVADDKIALIRWLFHPNILRNKEIYDCSTKCSLGNFYVVSEPVATSIRHMQRLRQQPNDSQFGSMLQQVHPEAKSWLHNY